MDTSSLTRPISAPPPTFIGLVFSLSGWALLETTLLSQHAALRAHLIPSLMALYLVSSSTKRLKLPKQLFPANVDSSTPQHASSAGSQAGWALFLLVVGAFIGTLIMGGSSILLGLTAAILTCAPWARIPFCRERIVIASLVTCVGIGLPLLTSHRSVSPIILLISGWLFWLCATFALFNRMGKLWQAERSIKAAARAARSA